MEISAKVYAIAKGEDKLKKLYNTMQECVPVIKQEGYYLSRSTGIDGWVELEEREYDVWDLSDWESMLERCGEELGEDGVVIVVYSSPDSDIYEEHASTTATGDTICCNTEMDFMDFENFDSRMDDFKEQFISSYAKGEELYKWFDKKTDFMSGIDQDSI